MPVFSYTAADRLGARISGTLAADTAANARRLLRDHGITLLELRETRFRRKRAFPQIATGRRRHAEAVDFARQMALLLKTGIPLVDALDVLINQQPGKFTPVLRDIRDRVAAGAPLSEALEEHADWFDGVFCSAVKVGQLSGQMAQALADLAAYVQERQALHNKIFTALAYPIILTVLGIGVVIFLMSYVVPQLLHVLETSGRPLPLSTMFLKKLSDTLVNHWLVLSGATAAFWAGGGLLYRWTPGRRWLHHRQLDLPVFGALIRKTLVAQFAQMMSLLLKSGVNFIEALRLVKADCRHLVLRQELAGMEAAIERGSDIAPTMAGSTVFPPLVLHIVGVGQKSGELTEMLAQLNEGYAAEVKVAVARFSAALEPLLIVALSAIVGFVVFATMMPILEATRAIQ